MWTPQSWYLEARTDAENRAQHIRSMADLNLATLVRSLPELPLEEIVRRLEIQNQARLDAVPSLTKYPELRGMRDLMAASWQGTKDGAGLTDAQSASHCGANFFYHRTFAAGRAMTGCTSVYFPRSDEGPLISKNLDSTPDEPIETPGWPALSEHLIIDTVSSGVFLDEEPPEIFPAPVMKLVARYCRNTREAVELLERYNYFWGPCNAIVVDREHNVAMIEKTACRIAVRWSEDGFGFVTAMAQEDPGMRAYIQERRDASIAARGLPTICADTEYWDAQDRRHQLLKELLDEARRNPTVESMRAMLQFRCPERGCVALCGEPIYPHDVEQGVYEHTLLTKISLLEKDRTRWWTYDKATNTPVWQNPQPDVSYQNPLVWQ